MPGTRFPSASPFFSRSAASVLLAVAVGVSCAANAVAQTITLVSVAPRSTTPVGGTTPAMSADGRFVAFMSAAPNLVPGDTNNAPDLFVKDMATGAISRYEELARGIELSADGRYVAFARNFMHRIDRLTGERLQNIAPGSAFDAMSANGQVLAWQASSGSFADERVRVVALDLTTGSTVEIGRPMCISHTYFCNPTGFAMSGNGRYFAYIGAGLTIHDRLTGVKERPLDVSATDWSAFALSADGRFVVFANVRGAPGFDFFGRAAGVWDRQTRSLEWLTPSLPGPESLSLLGPDSRMHSPQISSDGRHVAFVVARSGPGAALVRDRRTGLTLPVSGDLTVNPESL